MCIARNRDAPYPLARTSRPKKTNATGALRSHWNHFRGGTSDPYSDSSVREGRATYTDRVVPPSSGRHIHRSQSRRHLLHDGRLHVQPFVLLQRPCVPILLLYKLSVFRTLSKVIYENRRDHSLLFSASGTSLARNEVYVVTKLFFGVAVAIGVFLVCVRVASNAEVSHEHCLFALW